MQWVIRIVLGAALALVVPGWSRGQAITVSAAVSLREALSRAAGEYQVSGASRDKVSLNFGATGQLLAQIAHGAPVDVFISASEHEMDQAQRDGLIDPATRSVIALNTLVLIVPASSSLKLDKFQDLTGADVKRLAIGQPSIVPAGMYARQVLTSLHLWDSLKPRLIYGASVRQVLAYVERGEVDAGIVYATDARQSGKKVRVIATADAATHDPIRYVAAVVRASRQGDASRQFIRYLLSPVGQKALERYGFASPPPAHATPTSKPATMPTGR